MEEMANADLMRRINEGGAEEQYRYGSALFNGERIAMDKASAAHYFKLAADQGRAEMLHNHGCTLFDGNGIPMNKASVAHNQRRQGTRREHDRIVPGLLRNTDGAFSVAPKISIEKQQ